MSVKPVIELTADGSHTLFVSEINEHYHSTNGAIQESNHIFINAGLDYCSRQEINILEVGFGTGLNAFLTILSSLQKNKVINYTTLEKYPLSLELISELNYPHNYSVEMQQIYQKLHQADWNTNQEILENFSLKKLQVDFTTFSFKNISQPIDLIYFDAFAPDKQLEMWTQELFNELYKITNDKGILVTYCAKGIVRRMMQQAGYTVQRLPGPPGKREMLRAIK